MQYIVQNSLLLRFVFLSIVMHAWIYTKFPRASYKVGKGPVYIEGFLHTKHTQAFLRTVVSFFNTLFFYRSGLYIFKNMIFFNAQIQKNAVFLIVKPLR